MLANQPSAGLPDLLYLSHCVPNPPDKGEKIRAHFELAGLAKKYNVHLVCFARKPSEVIDAHGISRYCASVHVELHSFAPALARAGAEFAAGDCLNMRFYHNARMHSYVRDLAQRVPLAGAISYTVVMVPYVPQGLPYILDLLDVDSEKWFQYSQTRHPGFLYALEAKRLRRMEAFHAANAFRSFFTTRREEMLFRSFAPEPSTATMENGVDFDLFNPEQTLDLPELAGRRYVVFLGTMDYYPNIQAVCSFAESVLPELRRRDPNLEFFIVGRNPARAVTALGRTPGITVTGGVADTRPFLNHSVACVAPLQIARGIQNKVLESLAMGKWVLASTAVCTTFGADIPYGVIHCPDAAAYAKAFSELEGGGGEIRRRALRRFDWANNIDNLMADVDAMVQQRVAV
jgi:sugar transferase (PEP-CTERM/EpsH1 system associated)